MTADVLAPRQMLRLPACPDESGTGSRLLSDYVESLDERSFIGQHDIVFLYPF